MDPRPAGITPTTVSWPSSRIALTMIMRTGTDSWIRVNMSGRTWSEYVQDATVRLVPRGERLAVQDASSEIVAYKRESQLLNVRLPLPGTCPYVAPTGPNDPDLAIGKSDVDDGASIQNQFGQHHVGSRASPPSSSRGRQRA